MNNISSNHQCLISNMFWTHCRSFLMKYIAGKTSNETTDVSFKKTLAGHEDGESNSKNMT